MEFLIIWQRVHMELTLLDEVVLRVNAPVPVHIYAWGGGGGEGRSPSNYADRRSAGGGSAGSAGGSITLQPGTDYILRVGGGGLCVKKEVVLQFLHQMVVVKIVLPHLVVEVVVVHLLFIHHNID